MNPLDSYTLYFLLMISTPILFSIPIPETPPPRLKPLPVPISVVLSSPIPVFVLRFDSDSALHSDPGPVPYSDPDLDVNNNFALAFDPDPGSAIDYIPIKVPFEVRNPKKKQVNQSSASRDTNAQTDRQKVWQGRRVGEAPRSGPTTGGAASGPLGRYTFT
ncbi:hypothetical protein EVAR_82079_1 [Eumeta japonica]|uniref:Uncharacterized protein n=1 Tax=Eumeta variegata TaxID=151549 RepID=A0A4C1U2Z3_EUMVA|nr:hypothetical protein EVAR_82079_1 [Eumeta japonica]